MGSIQSVLTEKEGPKDDSEMNSENQNMSSNPVPIQNEYENDYESMQNDESASEQNKENQQQKQNPQQLKSIPPKRQRPKEPQEEAELQIGQKCRNIRLSKSKGKLLKILKQDNQQKSIYKILDSIELSTSKDEITEILSNFMKKSTALDLALDFYLGLRKDAIRLPKIELFYETLRKKNMPGEDVNIIKRYVQNGKKHKIKQVLKDKLGEYESSQLFEKFQTQFYQKIASPLNGSQFIKEHKGLKIYTYPIDYITEDEKLRSKSIIVLGETGCGKSTFLNSLTNYLACVQIQDPFRYYVVVENAQSQMKSITNEITSYYIKDERSGNCYRIIDTPGFGDTEGIEKDHINVKKIENLFKNNLQQVHLVLFLIKSSTTRVTTFQKYIFQSVMDLFDKTIAQNFVFVFTFADASKPVVLEHVKHTDGFGNYWNLLKKPKTIQVNNSGFFCKFTNEDKITKEFWKIGCQFLSKLIRKAQTISAKGLNITQQLIKKKQDLSHQIKTTSQKIQKSYY